MISSGSCPPPPSSPSGRFHTTVKSVGVRSLSWNTGALGTWCARIRVEKGTSSCPEGMPARRAHCRTCEARGPMPASISIWIAPSRIRRASVSVASGVRPPAPMGGIAKLTWPWTPTHVNVSSWSMKRSRKRTPLVRYSTLDAPMHVESPHVDDSDSCISSTWFGSSAHRCTRRPEGVERGSSYMLKTWKRAAKTTAKALRFANAAKVPAYGILTRISSALSSMAFGSSAPPVPMGSHLVAPWGAPPSIAIEPSAPSSRVSKQCGMTSVSGLRKCGARALPISGGSPFSNAGKSMRTMGVNGRL